MSPAPSLSSSAGWASGLTGDRRGQSWGKWKWKQRHDDKDDSDDDSVDDSDKDDLFREATSDRITLGVTAVLTLSAISLDSRSDLPKV